MALDTRILATVQQIGADIKALVAAVALRASTSYVDSSINSLRNELRGGASAAIDTFKEVADQLAADETAAAALAISVGNRVRFDAPQTLTAAQMLQACQNIGVGNFDQDLLAAYTAAKA
ncbi:hypothetical protein [Sphingomonas hankookensis]|uniref:hypothetical protein n=1 Tax=Sphingomonas hankookensis TaxID=563996 RepID=UPI003D30238F